MGKMQPAFPYAHLTDEQLYQKYTEITASLFDDYGVWHDGEHFRHADLFDAVCARHGELDPMWQQVAAQWTEQLQKAGLQDGCALRELFRAELS
jgi:hypothetical protein